MQHAGHDTPLSQEGETLKYEQALWERVRTGLTEVRTMLEDLEGVGTAARAQPVAPAVPQRGMVLYEPAIWQRV